MLKLKETREARGYTQDEIANYLGVSRPTYTRYEQGTRECSFETLKKIADFFDVSIDYLLGREISSNHPDPKVSKLLTDNDIDKIQLVKDLSIDEIKKLVELKNTILGESSKDKEDKQDQ